MATYGIVLKPIPGTGYGIGEPAVFNKDQEEKYSEYIEEGGYLKHIQASEYKRLTQGDEPEEEVDDNDVDRKPKTEKPEAKTDTSTAKATVGQKATRD
jgi:hypothetical protein